MRSKITAADIKAAINPVDFYHHELPDSKLKRHGWNDAGLCPFHPDNNAGSFKVNIETGAFKCFACNTSGGDIIAFTMALHGLEFKGALHKLANDWGFQ